MDNKVKTAEEYVNIILNDEIEKIVSETPTVYTDDIIERIYEFEDGAIVKYEWQSSRRNTQTGDYNHRFTLLNPPAPNPRSFKKGIIKQINYPGSFDYE